MWTEVHPYVLILAVLLRPVSFPFRPRAKLPLVRCFRRHYRRQINLIDSWSP